MTCLFTKPNLKQLVLVCSLSSKENFVQQLGMDFFKYLYMDGTAVNFF